MHIKSMSIDGFKSYGQKTDITGFDNLFNAITGLNGTGKSNILDAICFVLGLSNMSLARCSTLRELIYKNGQTGVQKASVAITFDNKDKSVSPTGYEQYDEVVIRREVHINNRTKYFINGFTATSSQVSDLFHSVQLNINNPHFLIMQGRITKVLNMKPHEILAMVEEATGVSMYESKKKATQGAIEKKQTALNHIDFLINDSIVPKFDQLRKEQTGLLEFQKISAEVEHLTKVYTAWQFIQSQELCDKTGTKVEEKKEAIEAAKNSINEGDSESRQMGLQIALLEKQKDEEFGGKLSELEDALKKAQMEEAKLVTDLNNRKDSLKEDQKRKKALDKQASEDKQLLAQKQNEFKKINGVFEKVDEERQRDEAILAQAQKDFEAISAGLSRAADGEAAVATLADQLIQAKNEVASATTEITKSNMKIKHSKEELTRKTSDSRKQEGSYQIDLKSVAVIEKEVEKLASELERIGFNEENQRKLIDQKRQLDRESDRLRDGVSNGESRYPDARFQYKAPGPQFDARKVYGVVCKLLTIKDATTATAIETAAGGKLYNVVVENQETAKQLLDRGQLQRRHTFLPLDKISGRDVDRRALSNAENLVGKNNVRSAISLVDFDPALEDAMKFVFGDVLVCPNMDIAKRVAFAPNVQKRTVTLDGEVFDPQGTLSGGARNKRGSLLADLAELKAKQNELEAKRSQSRDIEAQLRSMDTEATRYAQKKSQFDLKSHEAQLVKDRLKQTNQHRLMEEIELLRKSVGELEELLKELAKRKSEAEKKVNELQNKMKNSKSVRERELKEAEEGLKKAEKSSHKSRKAVDDRKQEVDSLRLEIQELEKTVIGYEDQMKDSEEEIIKSQKRVDEAADKVKESRETVAQINGEVGTQKKQLKAQSEEITKLQRKRDATLKRIEEKKLEIKKMQHEIEQIEKESQDAAKNVKIMFKKFAWIEEERHLFGNENAGYGFKKADFNANEVHRRLQTLQTKKSSMAKSVNMRANVMLSDKEKESEELRKKRKIIETDKAKLIQYIKEVDLKKEGELKKAHIQINASFGDIFSTLLPGTNARLMPPEGKTVMDGLEVKVAFGDVWKESLTELSGGQRSLVALSLILALLRYQPAPIYILDEVDAALDQNHTQNIGLMIKRHFSTSQFIIVSLKDDMFNNANVLFKTKFVDGTSAVTRHQGKSSHR